jgi:hypothetical protein
MDKITPDIINTVDFKSVQVVYLWEAAALTFLDYGYRIEIRKSGARTIDSPKTPSLLIIWTVSDASPDRDTPQQDIFINLPIKINSQVD